MTTASTDTRRRVRARPVIAILTTIVGGLLVWYVRRPEQLLHPYLWVEEYQILNRFQQEGFLAAAFHPYQGYFLLPTSFTVAFNAHWFRHLPELNALASTAWFVATMLLLLVPASAVPLRWRAAMAIAMTMVPVDPEVFGVLLYTFWWTGLWPLIALLWTRDYWPLRIAVLLIGGASGVAGAALAVPAAISYAITRSRRDLIAVLILVPLLGTQVAAYASSARSRAPVDVGNAGIQVLRNASFYLLGWVPHPPSSLLALVGAAALLLLGLLVASSVIVARRRGMPWPRELVLVGCSLVLLSTISAIPAPLIAHPVSAGPRYYFLPFLLLSWLLLLLVAGDHLRRVRPAAFLMLGLGMFSLSLSPGFSRRADVVNWSAELSRCRTEPAPFFIPVHYSGARAEMWTDGLFITKKTCRRVSSS